MGRLKTPASAKWSGEPCVFCQTNIVSTKSYSRRTHTLISSQRNDNINTDEVGYMTRNNIAGISAHYNCLLFTPGVDLIQDPVSQPENSLEDFQIDSIQRCVAKHSKKCCFCHKAGATAVCGNKRCKRFGWYHFPCGLQNGAVQREIETNTGTAVLTYCFKCSGKRAKKRRLKGREVRDLSTRL